MLFCSARKDCRWKDFVHASAAVTLKVQGDMRIPEPSERLGHPRRGPVLQKLAHLGGAEFDPRQPRADDNVFDTLDELRLAPVDRLGFATLAFNNISGIGRSGTGKLKVDGKVVDSHAMPKSLPISTGWNEVFNVGIDTATPVDDKDYQVPFRFTGKIDYLTVKLGPEELLASIPPI